MTISIYASAFDVNSWYQKITLTFINESGNAVDMNHAAISFTASGHIDPWGNSGGTLKGNLPLTLNESSYGTLETNNIIINNSDALLLSAGRTRDALFQPRGDAGAGKNVRHHLDAGVIVIRRRRV
ncbi:hypothetical protein LFZ31_15180 [Salmonella enterica subsp. enterica serovar Newport str. S09097]|nr:hypothetical protein LFZ31_15180 [Salmonella enterica subsp. enterica serovar Newport str. S09097]